MAKGSLLPAMWEVPESFRERLGKEAGRQRAMFADGHLLLVLHAPPNADDDTREGRFFWRAPGGEWRSTAFGSGAGALAKHLDEFRERLGVLEAGETKALSAKAYFDVLRDLTPLTRAARNLHNTLQQARELVKEDQNLIAFRDEAYGLDREIELLYSDTRNGLEYYRARKAEEQAEQGQQMAQAGHRLNVLAAMFFPLATMAALLGMNVPHGLEQAQPPGAFLLVLVLGLSLGWFVKSTFMDPKRSEKPRNNP